VRRVSVAQKRLDDENWYFGPKTSNGHTTKWAPLGPLEPSIPRYTQRVRAHILIEQPATVTLSVRGCLGGRLARGVQGSPAEVWPVTFCTKLASSVCLLYHTLGTKRMGRPSANDPCKPRAERPPRQPRTLSVTGVGCSMCILARTLCVERGMNGCGGLSGAHFVVCSLLVLDPKYHFLPSD
jgi:hypothetical protein